MSTPLWTPDADRIAGTEMTRFRSQFAPSTLDTTELWRWSVTDHGPFWRAVWDFAEIIGDPGTKLTDDEGAFHQRRFLPDATLNVAENLLAERPGANELAIVSRGEVGGRELSWHELRDEVAAFAGFLASAGVRPGDRVAAWMPNIAETVIGFLAAASIGAVFTSTSADFGVGGVVDRFGQTEPTVLIAADGYRYGGKDFDCMERLAELGNRLPSVTSVVVVPYLRDANELSLDGIDGSVEWSAAIEQNRGRELTFLPLPGDHPLFVLYSSGTTGKPKCIVHRASGVLLKVASEQRLHCDVRAGDMVYYFTTCGWMMWNWLVMALGTGATIILHDGNPNANGPNTVFDLADELDVTLMGVSAKWIDGSLKAGLRPGDTHHLSSVRTICSTGSPLSDDGFEWVYSAVKSDVHLNSMSGGTDLCGCLVAGDPTRPVFRGEIQGPCLGMEIEVYDEHGVARGPGHRGELVCAQPFPSMPLHFWGDDGSRYRAAYFQRFDGVWAHGDYAQWTDNAGIIILGRSDATLNASGVRIGTAEIYGVVEGLDEVVEAIAVGQQWENDTRIVLFVRTAERATLDDELAATIRRALREQCSPRHVPAVIAEVGDIPRTRSGKITEMAVTDVIHGRAVANAEALANPEALELFRNRPELSEG